MSEWTIEQITEADLKNLEVVRTCQDDAKELLAAQKEVLDELQD